jgi:hypothetical protein
MHTVNAHLYAAPQKYLLGYGLSDSFELFLGRNSNLARVKNGKEMKIIQGL